MEQEMVPKDKYTIFDRKEKKYRKSIRSEFRRIEMTEAEKKLMIFQSCRSGREYHNESILLDTDRIRRWEWVYHITVKRHKGGVLVGMYIIKKTNGMRDFRSSVGID